MTLYEARAVLNRIQLGSSFTSWGFEPSLLEHDRAVCWILRVKFKGLEDTLGRGAVTTIFDKAYRPQDIEAMSEERFVLAVAAFVHLAVNHELDECLRLDGEPVHDPHAGPDALERSELLIFPVRRW